MTEVDQLLQFCRRGKARFISDSGTWPQIPIFHGLEDPPGTETQKALRLVLPESVPELRAFYEQADGATLFANADDPQEAFFFVPVESLEMEKAAVYEWLTLTEPEDPSDWGEEAGDDGGVCIYGPPEWWSTAVVFGRFGYSPESFVLATEGPHTGRVFQLDHDIGALDKVFDSITELFSEIINSPTEFIRKHYGVAYFDIIAFEQESA